MTAPAALRTLIVLLLLMCGTPKTAESEPAPSRPPRVAKFMCLGRIEGCPCFAQPDARSDVRLRLFHNEAVIERELGTGAFVRVARYDGNTIWKAAGSGGEACYVAAHDLRWQPVAVDVPVAAGRRDHTPMSLRRLFLGLERFTGDAAARDYLMALKRSHLGRFWFTYYHLALEDHHPGAKVPVVSPGGAVLGQASKEFLDQVRWEGSGLASDGTRYHFSGTDGRYMTYTAEWGLGAGGAYEVFPYRTIAVNFAGFCARAHPHDAARRERCRRGGLLGTAVFVRQIADRKIRMDDGSIHDGWMCVTDTGSPSYIREDRVDIFVGAHGGGNPYLPASRQWNHFFAAGLKNSVPWDWRLWPGERDRVWCDVSAVPKEGEVADPKRHCLHDYHTTTPEKAITLEMAYQENGEPVRCRNGRELRSLK